MEFNLVAFTQRLRDLMYDKFPFENEYINKSKHKNRPGHIRDVAFRNNDTEYGENYTSFVIGNHYAEERYPYYHILEDSPYIRKRGKGSEATKGSQDKVSIAGGGRDYNRITFNGKVYTREYEKNVRGSRSRLSNVQRKVVDYMGQDVVINRGSNSYLNIHYKYIERMLEDSILDDLALEFGLRKMRTQKTSLQLDYDTQDIDDIGSIVDIINSFVEE